MKRWYVYTIVSLLVLTSCSKYQFVTLTSDIPKAKSGSIIIENDSLILEFRFSGPNGNTHVLVANKLSVPLYLRANQVLLIKDTWPTSRSEKPVYASIKGNILDNTSKGSTAEYIRAENPQQLVVVPPQSIRSLESIMLKKKFFQVSTPDMKTGQLNGHNIRFQYYSRQDTPLVFINSFDYSIDQNFDKSAQMTHEFWVDEVLVTMSPPEHLHEYRGREDVFYLKKGSGLGIFLGSIGVAAYFAASQGTE